MLAGLHAGKAIVNPSRGFKISAIDEDTIPHITVVREDWRVPVCRLDSSLQKDGNQGVGFPLLRKPREKMTASRRLFVEAGEEVVAGVGLRREVAKSPMLASFEISDFP